MSNVIRNTHLLPTIRIRFRPARSGAQLTFDSYYGSEQLKHRDIPAEVVGIRPTLSVREYRWAQFELPDDVTDAMASSLAKYVNADEPCWLQVGASSGHLAVVPWERLLQGKIGAPLLRIPNFLADPVFLSGRLRLALCVSSPQAKTPFSAADYACMVVNVVRDAVHAGTEVHIFADMDAFHELQARLGPIDGHNLVIHDPHDALPYEAGDVDSSLRRRDAKITSPWLRWMADSLTAVDAVHFVCPGYFRRDQGALALARAPFENVDRQWSHFVGVEELIAFLNRVGAWATVFSPPFDNVWAIGLRLLADRLAWQRPGPLLLHDTENGTPEDLFDAYRFLFSGAHTQPPATSSLMLYSHPNRLEHFGDELAKFESISTFGLTDEEVGEIPEDLDSLVMKLDRGARGGETTIEEPWQQSTRRLMDQVLLRTEGQNEATRQGMMDALTLVNQLLDSTDSRKGGA